MRSSLGNASVSRPLRKNVAYPVIFVPSAGSESVFSHVANTISMLPTIRRGVDRRHRPITGDERARDIAQEWQRERRDPVGLDSKIGSVRFEGLGR